MDSIGQQLASARRRKGLNLKEVEEATKIRFRFLEALEAENFDIIPGPVYVKGFIRSYASYLKIDPKPLVDEYKKVQPAEQITKVEAVASFAPVDKKRPLKGRQFSIPAALLTLVFLMTVFLAYLGYQDTVQSSKLNDKKYVNRELRQLENTRKKKKITKHKSKTKTKIKTKKRTSKQAASSEIFSLRLTVTEGTWVKVSADGKTFFGQYLRKGVKKAFISRKPLEVTVGKGSKVKVYFNGRYKGLISEESSIATKVYKK